MLSYAHSNHQDKTEVDAVLLIRRDQGNKGSFDLT